MNLLAWVSEMIRSVLNEQDKALRVEVVGGGIGGGGMEFLFGTTAPNGGDGENGDIYLNATNGDLYKKTDTWEQIGNLKGPKGEKGTNGAKGEKGDKGFGTEAQYNDIIARLEALESKEQ